jgi:hypothetical protein
MPAQKPVTAIAAAIASATEFKSMIDRLPAGTPLFPGAKRLLHASACYAEARSLLQQAITQNDQAPVRVGLERNLTLPVVGVISNQTTDAPANYFQLFASVTAAIAQFALDLVDECGGSSKDGGLLKISACLIREDDLTGEKIKGKIDAVHDTALNKVIEQTLCHDPALLDSLMLQAFSPTCARTPRGHAYMAGTRAYLAFCLSGAEGACAYEPGTDAYDAYHAGIDEGRTIWTRHQTKAAQ